MSRWTKGWRAGGFAVLMVALYLGGLEIAALWNDATGDTASEHVWDLVASYPALRFWGTGAMALIMGFLGWLTVHFFWDSDRT